jgi:hypothetical protein
MFRFFHFSIRLFHQTKIMIILSSKTKLIVSSIEFVLAENDESAMRNLFILVSCLDFSKHKEFED